MLSEEIKKLENENQRLVVLVKQMLGSIPKRQDCESCKYYVQHYGRDEYGTYYRIYAGHCKCGVPAKKRKGKSEPEPEDTCLCFKERKYK